MQPPQITMVENTAFPSSSGTESDELARVQKLRRFRKRERKLLARLRRSGTENSRVQRKALREIKGSVGFRICGALDANKRISFPKRQSLASLFHLAECASWNSYPSEQVIVRCKPKSSGGYRTICDFGFQNKLMQYSARKVLFQGFKPTSFQYDFKGKGNFGGHR